MKWFITLESDQEILLSALKGEKLTEKLKKHKSFSNLN